MGAHSNGRRALAAFFGLSVGVVMLFGLVALVALRPVDSLAWVQVPDLAADLRLDAGLQTKPLKNAVVAEALGVRCVGDQHPRLGIAEGSIGPIRGRCLERLRHQLTVLRQEPLTGANSR